MGEIEDDFSDKYELTRRIHPPSIIHQTFVKDIAPDLNDAEAQMAILNHFNGQGWELVNVQGRFAYFKRVNPEWVAQKEAEERQRLARMRRR